MAEEKTAKPKTNSEKEIVYVAPPGGLPFVYANNVQIGQTTFDLRIVFGEVTGVYEETIEVTQRVSVTMSWLEAKALSEFLASYVRIFEERNGPMMTTFAKFTQPTPPAIPKITDSK